jgi:tetratricopeptide (TPR) repeat protein
MVRHSSTGQLGQAFSGSMAENQTINVVPTDYERLVRFVTQPGQEFALAIVRYADPNVRDRLIERIQQDAEQMGVRVKRLDLHDLPDDANLLETISSNLEPNSEQPIQAVFVVRFEHALVDPLGAIKVAPSIHGFNIARDQLPARVRTRLVLWLSDAAANAFADQARDLYDVVVAFFRFDDRDEPRAIHSYRDAPDWMTVASPQDVPKLRREAALLESVFEHDTRSATQADAAARIGQIEILTGNAEIGQTWWQRALKLYQDAGNVLDEGHLLLRIGTDLVLRGDLDSAQTIFESVKRLFQDSENIAVVAEAEDGIADILEARGQFDEALRIRRENILPIVEKLGNIREIAIMKDKIAEILYYRGQFDEALKIRIEQQLPVYQQLGDIRAIAIAQGKIASILLAQGQFDEALKIQTEQLPLFEQLGEIRSIAIARSQIATILWQIGHRDQAINAYRNQILPVCTQLEDKRNLSVCQLNFANMLLERGQPDDIPEARELLNQALQAAREMQIPEVQVIQDLITKYFGPNA